MSKVQDIRRPDAVAKVTGKAKFTADLKLPGLTWGKVLRSPLPHARIRAFDTKRAEQLPGVLAVLTEADVRDLGCFGAVVEDRPVLAGGKVRFVGEPVAAVAAVDEETAEEALSLIDVEYEELPVVEGLLDKTQPAAAIHSCSYPKGATMQERRQVQLPNLCYTFHAQQGEPERAWRECHHIFEQHYQFPAVFHYTMEPHAAIADFDGDELCIWTSAQHPYMVRKDLARMFRLPLGKVRVIVPYIGGGFGGKSFTKIEPLTAALARKAGRPVCLALSVEEAFQTNRRHAAEIFMRTGLDREGRIVVRHVTIYLDGGAYADNGPLVAEKAAMRSLGPYRTPHYRLDAYLMYTNTTPAGSFRAIGGPQGIWACECQMDEMAAALDLDPLTFRLHNLPRRGEVIRTGLKPMDADLPADLELLARLPLCQPESNSMTKPYIRRATGLACAATDPGAIPISVALLRLHADGTVSLFSGSTEMGQGVRTVLAQIIQAELGLGQEQIQVVEPDSRHTPYDTSTGASRSTVVMGLAVKRAAEDLKEQLRLIAADHWGIPPSQVEASEGRVFSDGRSAELQEVLQWRFGGSQAGELVGVGSVGYPEMPEKPIFWEIGLGRATIEVDLETGWLRPVSYDGLADVGKAMHHLQLRGQEEGSIMMGLGHSLFEEMCWQAGQPLNFDLADYRVPLFSDYPEQLYTHTVEAADGPGPYGAKGGGEGGILPVAPAIASALFQATGLRMRNLPLTPERVWRGLQELKQGVDTAGSHGKFDSAPKPGRSMRE